MNIELKSVKTVLKRRSIYPTAMLFLINIAIVIGIITLGNNLFLKYKILETEKDALFKLRSKVVLVRNNKEIFNGKIEEYNIILGRLIPDEESYFSVISALETLASKTGVTIDTYTIDLKSTTVEKLTLSLGISGDPGAINQLLQNYTYVSGRLLTNEKSTFSSDEDQKEVSISFNFYHKPFKDAVSPGTIINEKDIQLLEEISLK